METISILGCGWLGLPLAEHLVNSGYKVKGSTRTKKDIPFLESKGIEPSLLVLDPEIHGSNLNNFFDGDILIINFPPERREDIVKYHERQAVSLIETIKLSSIKKVVFASSTSVYPDLNREVTEDEMLEPSKPSGKALLQFESLLSSRTEFKTTVLIFAGLIGYDRKPGRFLAGKKEVMNGQAPVNLIHQDDCVNIIHQIIQKNMWGETFNACADLHPTRKEYYIHAANRLGLTPPTFVETNDLSYKIVGNEKLKKKLNYIYKYPDPFEIDKD
ncbi:MAG: SDR family oxidoreductase [Thermodesulfobacteriota bacterium]